VVLSCAIQTFVAFPQFRVVKSGILKVEAFDTEERNDPMTVNDREYSGTDGPNSVAVEQGTSITWSSDVMVTKPGFKVCLIVSSSVPSPAPTSPSPDPSQAPSGLPTVTASPVRAPTFMPSQTPTLDSVSLVSGPCFVEGACFLSPNYPSDYGNSQSCEASIHFDYLFRNCYSMVSSPL
jgi:hypothetical protein